MARIPRIIAGGRIYVVTFTVLLKSGLFWVWQEALC